MNLQRKIIAEKIAEVVEPYSGNYLSAKEVKRIIRVLTLNLTGGEKNPQSMRFNPKESTRLKEDDE